MNLCKGLEQLIDQCIERQEIHRQSETVRQKCATSLRLIRDISRRFVARIITEVLDSVGTGFVEFNNIFSLSILSVDLRQRRRINHEIQSRKDHQNHLKLMAESEVDSLMEAKAKQDKDEETRLRKEHVELQRQRTMQKFVKAEKLKYDLLAAAKAKREALLAEISTLSAVQYQFELKQRVAMFKRMRIAGGKI